MGGFIALLAFLSLGILALVGGIIGFITAKTGDGESVGAGFALVGLVVSIICGVIVTVEAYEQVPARTVAVETKSGKPVAVLQNGGHWIAPYAQTAKFDATIQSIKEPVGVRLKNNTKANVDVSVQWKIDPDDQFLGLYNNYRTFDNVKNNVVQRQLAVALNNQFANWDPLAAIDKTTGSASVSVTDFAKPVEAAMQAQMPPGLDLISVAVVGIDYSNAVQDNLDLVTKQAAQTVVAQNLEQTNKAQAAANAALGNGAQAYQQNCLDVTKAAIVAKVSLPASWNCNNGSGTPLTIAAK